MLRTKQYFVFLFTWKSHKLCISIELTIQRKKGKKNMEQIKDKKNDVDYYFHYTTQETLCSLLNKYRKDKAQGSQENLIFWASSIFTMNDPQEMKHGVEVFKKLIPINEEFYKDVYNLSPEERLNLDYFNNEEFLSNQSNTPFVISFSKNRDDLAMWTLYGEGGHGVVLKFNKDLESISTDVVGVTKPEDVYYGNGSDKMQLFFAIYFEGLQKLRNCQDDGQEEIIKKETINKLYTHLCPFIKTESYRKEKESRLSYYDVPNHFVNFRTRNKNIIPYIEVPIPIKYLEEIIIGPCCDFELAQSSIRYLLDCCGLQRIQISKSSIPYRNL